MSSVGIDLVIAGRGSPHFEIDKVVKGVENPAVFIHSAHRLALGEAQCSIAPDVECALLEFAILSAHSLKELLGCVAEVIRVSETILMSAETVQVDT
jgi:hypothetical protein